MITINKSKELYQKATQLSPAGVHSPVRAFRSVGGTPLFFNKGLGSKIWDVDGNEFLDFCMSWGALALGHAHPDVVKAIQTQAALGTHYGTPNPHDVALAELALEHLKPYDMIRFVNSGTEAVMTALRLARGITRRSKILKLDGSYHGHVDSLLVAAGSGLVTQGVTDSAGVTEGQAKDTLVIPYDNDEALEKVFAEQGSEIAALIIEPVMANNGLFEMRKEYLQKMRELTKKHGALFIFDEVITGFRVHSGGAKARYGIDPDIGTYGKIIGGGLPVGAIAAKREIMENLAPMGKVYQAGTLSGNPIAMTAGLASLNAMNKEGFWSYTEELGQVLDKKVKQLKAQKSFYYKRVGSIFWFCLDRTEGPASPKEISQVARDSYRTLFHSLLNSKIYTAPSAYEVGFLSRAHTEHDIQRFIEAVEQA